jgi:electron transport complex protein RnfD
LEERKLVVSAAPHIRAPETTSQLMFWVIVALAPATLVGLYFYKLLAVQAILMSVVGAVGSEALMQKLLKKPVTIYDGSAALTGLLLALTLPPRLPWWLPLVGGMVAILLGKAVFGGLGHNIFNPALVSRAILLLSWPQLLTKGSFKLYAVDTITKATPLFIMKEARAGTLQASASSYYGNLFFGNLSGAIGEISALVLIIGGLILIWRRVIRWRIPVTFLASVAVFTLLFGADPIFYLLAGGLLLGAFFMATDYVSSPITPRGQIAFGIGCGFITVLLRFYSGLPEGVMFAILFMNSLAPLLDKYTQPRMFGTVKA